MSDLNLEAIVSGAPSAPWLRQFDADPDTALGKLLVGGAELGRLSAAEPADLLLDWLDALAGRTDFAARLDAALSRWIETRWGVPALPEAADSAQLTATAWCRTCDVIAWSEALGGAASRLRERVVKGRHFLAALAEGRSRDPLARAWLAIARHQPDRALLHEWWTLCRLPLDEPWYRGELGIHGLRGLPPAQPRQGGGFPDEVAQGVMRLGEALANRVSEGWLDEPTGRDELRRIARQTMAAYPFREKWTAFFKHALVRSESHELTLWVRGLFPGGLDVSLPPGQRPAITGNAQPLWAPRVRDIAQRLQEDPKAIVDANALLRQQGLHANATGDPHFLVRSACNFAGRLRERDPEQALQWSELARRSDPWNGYAWTTSAACLLTLGRLEEAVEVADEAVRRFPDNVVARTGLAEVLRARGQLDLAEQLYRDTINRFPDNVVARNGLAEVLRARGQLKLAEQLYRDTVDRFPNNVVARCGLAEVLRARGQLDLAEQLYRDTVDRFPDEIARSGLKNVRRELETARTGAVTTAEHPPLPAAESTTSITVHKAEPSTAPRAILDSDEIRILLTDFALLRQWGRRTQDPPNASTPDLVRKKARSILERFAAIDARAAGELALSLLNGGELREAAELLRAAVKRFPGSARVRYALARAERELALEEKLRLDAPGAIDRVIRPWTRLGKMIPQLQPAALLGEGRAWLALVDGDVAAEKARGAFWRLERWVTRDRPPAAEHSPEAFDHWWASQIRQQVFGAHRLEHIEDLTDLGPLKAREKEHRARIDSLEEEAVMRSAEA